MIWTSVVCPGGQVLGPIMRIALLPVIGSCCALWSASASAKDDPPLARLRLEDAVTLALSTNERARISDYQVLVAEAAVEKARSAFLPVLQGVGSDQQHAYAATDR